MEKWLSSRNEMSNGELLCVGLALLFAGRLFVNQPDPEAQARTALFAAGAAAGAATAATQPAAPAPAQSEAQAEQTAPGWGYEPPQYGTGYPFGGGGFFGRG